MASVELSQDGRTATVNGQLVAMEGLRPDEQEQIRGLAAQSAADPANQMPIVAGMGGVPSPVEADGGPQWAVPPAEPSAPIAAPAATPTASPVGAAPRPPSPPSPQHSAGPRFARVTNKTTSTQGVVGADKMLEEQRGLAEKGLELEGLKADYEVRAAEMRAGAHRDAVLAKEKAAAEVERVRMDGQAEAEKYMQRAQETRAEAQALQEKGHNFWANRNAGERVLAGIGAFLGGIGAAHSGGPNRFMQHLQMVMGQEARAYQEKVDGLRKDADAQMSFYDIANKRTDDSVEATLQAETMQLDTVKSMLDEQLAGLEATDGRAVMVAEGKLLVEQQLAEKQQQLAARQTVNAQTRMVPVRQQVSAQQLGPDGKPVKMIPGTTITDPEAYAGLSAEERKIARRAAGAANALYDSLEQMKQARAKYGTEAFDSKAATDYKNLSHSARVSLSQILEAGVITKEDAEQMDKALWSEDLSPKVSDLGRIFGNDATMNQLESAQNNVQTQVNQRLRGYGVKIEGLATPNKRLKGAQGGW